MSAADEQPYRADKVVKRGLTGKEGSPNKEFIVDQQGAHGSPIFTSLPVCSNELKSACQPRARIWRGIEEWTPRGFIFVVIAFLSIFALSGSFMYAHSLGRTPMLDDSYTVSYSLRSELSQNSQAFGSGTDGFTGSELSDTSSSSQRSILDELGSTKHDTDAAGDGNFQGRRRTPPGCNEKSSLLRVFMYDLPPEFHYGMLAQPPYINGQIWPRNVSDLPMYPGGLYQQHSPEYWLTSDLLTSNMADRQSACTAFRVSDWKAADVIFVPFFASLSYNKYTKSDHKIGGELSLEGDKNQELQEKLLKFLRQQPAWLESGGCNHIIVIHHPNSMHVMRDHLRNAMFVVADFGRYASEVANIGKDIVAPYKHLIPLFDKDFTSYSLRKTLLFFQGAIVRKEGGIIRHKLYEMLKDEAGVHFEAGNTGSSGIHSATSGMQGSKFCLHLAGDTPSSNRLFDAIASHCVPVIISDDIELPYEDDLDYTEFCLFIKSTDALQKNHVINKLRRVGSAEWTKMWKRLKQVDHHFKYQYPTELNDAVNMVWKSIAHKVPAVKFLLHKKKRYNRSRQHRTM